MGKLKKKTKIAICVWTVVFLLIVALSLAFMSSMSFFYSEKHHLARIRSLAEERFLGEDRIYTDLDVYPIYNEEDKLEYALIELKPQGYLYVKINKSNLLNALGAAGMYTMNLEPETEPIDNYPWTPYRMNGEEEVPFTDETGEPIVYHDSYFKVRGIENERRYFLEAYNGLIPAVKRGEQYLDLIDGELIDYEPGVYPPKYAAGKTAFIGASNFDL